VVVGLGGTTAGSGVDASGFGTAGVVGAAGVAASGLAAPASGFAAPASGLGVAASGAAAGFGAGAGAGAGAGGNAKTQEVETNGVAIAAERATADKMRGSRMVLASNGEGTNGVVLAADSRPDDKIPPSTGQETPPLHTGNNFSSRPNLPAHLPRITLLGSNEIGTPPRP